MFLVYLSAILTSILFLLSLCGISDGLTGSGFILAIAVILWLTSFVLQFCRGHCRRPWQSSGRRTARFQTGCDRSKLSDPSDHSSVQDISGASLNKRRYFYCLRW